MLNLYTHRQWTHLLFALFCLFGVSACSFGPPKEDTEVQLIPFPEPPNPARFYYESTITSSADVTAETEDQAMQRWLTGVSRTGIGMAKPHSVAVYKGKVYVSDTAARYVRVFDKPAGKYYTIGEEAPGELVKPVGIEVDSAGNVYVMDLTLGKVLIYDPEGKFLRTIGNKEDLDMASSLAIEPDGSKIYIVDTGGVRSQNHHILVYDGLTGEKERIIGRRGQGELEFNLPKDAEFNPVNNLLYIVDSANFRVQAINPRDGSYSHSFGSIGRMPGQFARPKGIGIDPEGRVYVSDAAFGNFQIFTPDGQLLLAVGSRGSRLEPAKFMLPAGIEVDEDGRVYMVDQYFQKIDVFRPVELAEDKGYFGTAVKLPTDAAAPAK